MTRSGVVLGSVTTDLVIDVIERFNLLQDARGPVLTLGLGGKALCRRIRARAVRSFASRRSVGQGAGARGVLSQWYEDSESLLYCVYEPASKPRLPRPEATPAADAKAENLELVALVLFDGSASGGAAQWANGM